MEKQSKRRMAKMQKQFEIYLDYVRRYSVLKLNWVAQKGYTTELNNIWQDMTVKLNDCGGPIRDAMHWKKVFTEWKSHTRRKLKYNKPLNKIEKELIDLTGLTSMPERKRKSEKPLKDKTSAESNKPAVNNENGSPDMIIKDEILDDWSDASSTGFIEGEEIIDRDCAEVHSKTAQKIVNQEKKDTHKKQIAGKENPSEAEQQQQKKKVRKYVVSEKSEKSKINIIPKTANVSVQVDQEVPKDVLSDGLGSLSRALLTLSSAINRYCEIVERRIF